ncbi:MAG: hypothetical protein JSU83_17990, partial [Deltaproteobacteria bacterium]
MTSISTKSRSFLLTFTTITALLFFPAIMGCQRLSSKFIGIQSIRAADLQKIVKSSAAPLILDIRETQSFREGHIPGSIRLDMESIDGYLEKINIPRQRPVVAVCTNGWDSQVAAAIIMAHGYRNGYTLIGGITRWRELGFPLQKASSPD